MRTRSTLTLCHRSATALSLCAAERMPCAVIPYDIDYLLRHFGFAFCAAKEHGKLGQDSLVDVYLLRMYLGQEI